MTSSRHEKIPIVRTEVLDPGRLDGAARRALSRRLLGIYTHYFSGLSSEQLRELILERGEGTRVLLMYGSDGELASFGPYRLERLVVGGRAQLVFTAGAYSRRGYSGVGPTVFRHGLRVAARAKLRAPTSSLHAVLQMANGPAYRAIASRLACVHPHPDIDPEDTPREVTALLRAVLRARGLETVADHPFVIRNPFPVQQTQLELITKLRGDPYVDLFGRMCTAPEHVLATYFPLGPTNLLASAIPPLRRPYRHLCQRIAAPA